MIPCPDIYIANMTNPDKPKLLLLLLLLTSSGDLQPSTAIANQLPGH